MKETLALLNLSYIVIGFFAVYGLFRISYLKGKQKEIRTEMQKKFDTYAEIQQREINKLHVALKAEEETSRRNESNAKILIETVTRAGFTIRENPTFTLVALKKKK